MERLKYSFKYEINCIRVKIKSQICWLQVGLGSLHDRFYRRTAQNTFNTFAVDKNHRNVASPRLQMSVKYFRSFLEEICPVKSLLKPSEPWGDIVKDSGMHAAILDSNSM